MWPADDQEMVAPVNRPHAVRIEIRALQGLSTLSRPRTPAKQKCARFGSEKRGRGIHKTGSVHLGRVGEIGRHSRLERHHVDMSRRPRRRA